MKPKALFVMLILWLSFTTIQARSTEDVPDKGTYAKFLLVGCYMKPDEEGVRMYRFDGQTADVDYPCGLRGISNPAFLTSDSTGNRIVSIRPRACFSPSYNKVKSQTKHVWLLTLL